MQRLIGITLVAAAVILAVLALLLFGVPTRQLPAPPPRTVGGNTVVYSNVEVRPSAVFVVPVLALLGAGTVLLVLPRPSVNS